MSLSSHCVSYFPNGITAHRSCVSVIWEPPLDPPFPSALVTTCSYNCNYHVTTMAPHIGLQICPVCSNLTATAHFVSCLQGCRSFPFPPPSSPWCIGMKISQAQAPKKHMIHSFSYTLREQPSLFKNNHGQHLRSTYYVLGTVSGNLCTLTPLIVLTTSWDRQVFYHIPIWQTGKLRLNETE